MANFAGTCTSDNKGLLLLLLHYTVPVSPQCPQEISLLTLSVPGRSGLQRALLSVSSAQKCSGAERLAAPFEGL